MNVNNSFVKEISPNQDMFEFASGFLNGSTNLAVTESNVLKSNRYQLSEFLIAIRAKYNAIINSVNESSRKHDEMMQSGK